MRKWPALALAGMALLLSSCGGGTTFNATPVLSSVSPTHVTAGGPMFELNVVALNVITTSTVDWNGSPRTTTLNPTTGQLVAQILASDIATPGTAELTVVSPPPGGGMSNSYTFFIDPVSNPAPTITSLSPSSTAAGGAGFSLTVNGTGFVQNNDGSSLSVVSWNGSPRTTTFVSATQISAAILAPDIATAGTANVTVTNPSPGGGVSSAAAFTIGAAQAHPASLGASGLDLVSIGALGGAANGPSGSPAIDASGRFVAFQSRATNLVSNGSGSGAEIFVRDTCFGATACTPRTIPVDVAPDGSGPNGAAARGLAISADGRYVAFASHASNLLATGDAAGTQLYLRDTCLGIDAPQGCAARTYLISVSSTQAPHAGDGPSEYPSVSADGRFVSFASAAENLVAGAGGGTPQVYLRDTCLGASASKSCAPSTVLISRDATGRPGKGASLQSSISATGRFVAFDSEAPNLVAELSNGVGTVLVRDTCIGATSACTPATHVVSGTWTEAAADAASFTPAISADGRFIAFASRAGNLLPGVRGGYQKIFVRDTCEGGSAPASCTPSTSFVSAQAAGNSHSPAISGDGSLVTFVADDAPANPAGGMIRTYAYRTCAAQSETTGCTAGIALLATSSTGRTAELPNGSARFAVPINADGSALAFFSVASTTSAGRNTTASPSGFGDVYWLAIVAAP
jgi:hypothetical protein